MSTSGESDEEDAEEPDLPLEECALRIDGSGVRMLSGEDGAMLVSAVDVVCAITHRTRDYAGQVLRRIQARADTQMTMILPVAGGHAVAYCDAGAATRLLMACPGKAAQATRVRYADALVAHMRGDPALVTEIVRHNAAVPRSVLHFLGYTPVAASALAQISDFAYETVRRLRSVQARFGHMRTAHLDEAGRISALTIEVAALTSRVERAEERAARAERAVECLFGT
jgi:hypothetical protein